MLINEIQTLSPSCHLLSYGDWIVFCAKASQIPECLLEIGRLRALAFRTMKGDSNQLDLDPYDPHYSHLFVWNKKTQEIISACRLGFTDVILKNFGKSGLYTTSLFHVEDAFFDKLGPALEFGRTFVREEYQKEYAPLLYLFKGICTFVALNPQYQYLFGLISLSQNYHLNSQALITRFFEEQVGFSSCSQDVKPRQPVSFSMPKMAHDKHYTVMDLNREVKKSENGLRSMPILVKKYLKFNTKLVAYGRDPDFGDCLDLLCVADLANSEEKILQRYMGERVHAFLSYHNFATSSSNNSKENA